MRHTILKALLVVGSLGIAGSASAESVGYKVLENEPDHDNLYLAGSVYYAMVGSNFLNFGLHAQGTYVIAPALEIQGSGMLNMPGSSIGLFHAEGSAFLAIPWIGAGRINVSSYSYGNTTVTNYLEVPDIERKKFGLDVGGYFDTHGVKVYENSDPRAVTGVGVFAGLKWAYQNKSETRITGYGTYTKYNRFAYYVHVIRSLTMGYSEDDNVREQPSQAPIGGRFGMEAKFNGETAFFLKYEAGAMPSVRGPDWNMFVFLGVSHSRQLF